MEPIEKARKVARDLDLRGGFGRPHGDDIADAQLHALIAIYDLLAVIAEEGEPGGADCD